MKKLITAAALLWAMAGTLSAQTVTGFKCPHHPLKPNMFRHLADSVIKETYWKEGNRKPQSTRTKTICKYSKDRLTDTVTFYRNDTTTFFQKYTPDGHLLYLSTETLIPLDVNKSKPQKGLLISKYTYGEDGRLLKLEVLGKGYNDQPLEKLYIAYNYTYMMTDSGYVVEQTSSDIDKNKTEYVLDKKGRVIRVIDRDEKDRYITGDNGQRYRIGDFYYSYTDSGYTELHCMRADFCTKTDFIFDKKGRLKKEIVYKRTGENQWELYDSYGYFYFYKDGNPHSNIRIGKVSGRVYGTVGGAVVETEQTVEAAVYTFGGQPVKRQRIGAGTTRIPLPAGFYLITLNGTGHKVVVK